MLDTNLLHSSKSTSKLPTLSNTCDTLMFTPFDYIGIDWLSMSFRGNLEKLYFFNKKDEKRPTPLFKDFCYLEYNNEVIAECVYNPRMSTLQSDTIIIKFKNHILYGNKLKLLVDLLRKEKCLIFSHIVRIDLFTDFQTTIYDENPQIFLKDIVNNKIAKNNYCKLQVVSKISKEITIESLKFGRYSSRLCYQIYDKSKEQLEVKQKQWIIDSWKKNNFDLKKTIYRCEFQICNKNINWSDKNTGEITEINSTITHDNDYLYNTLLSLAENYLTFFRVDKKINKRYWKKINWYKNDTSNYKILKSSVKVDSTRADRIFLKKLYNEYLKLKECGDISYIDYQTLINDFVSRKGLDHFYKKLIESASYCLDNSLLKNKQIEQET